MTSLPEMNIPDVPYKEYDITFYDGTMRHIYVTDVCISSKKFDTIASKADTKGFITDVNDAFVQISGYKKEILSGSLNISCAILICQMPHLKRCGKQ